MYFITDGEPVVFRNFMSRALLRKIAVINDVLASLSRGRIKPSITRRG